MGPINYLADVQSPFQAALQGYQGGAAIRDDQMQQQMMQAKLLEQERARQAQMQMQQELAALSSNPNAGARDYAAMTVKYPQLREQFKQSWDMIGKDRQAGLQDMMTRAYAALSSGRGDIAEQIMRDRAAAMRNSGNEDGAKPHEMWADLIKDNPQQAKHLGALMLSSVDPEKFATTFATLGAEGRAVDEAPSKLAESKAKAATAQAEATIKRVEANAAPTTVRLKNEDVQSQIDERANRLKLDRDKLTSDVQMKLYELGQKATTLDDGAKKLINDNAVAAASADQSAGQMLDLADRLEKSAATSGLAAKGAELYKSITGNQDAISQLRQEYTRLRSTQVSKMLPPGPASDKDIQLALSGFPADTADAKTMAAFVRGMAKLSQAESVMSSAKAEWINSVGSLAKPKADIEIDGTKVPAGTNFADFARQMIGRKVEARAAEQNAQQLQGRSYMRWANGGQ